MSFLAGILTISTKGARGEREDTSGAAIREMLSTLDAAVERYEVIPDDRATITQRLVSWADDAGLELIVTTGGTGPAVRDVTPEATEAVCGKMMPGFGELMRQVSLKFVPTAILSRQTAGIRGKSLIVNLPGKPSAIHDCLLAVFPAIPYCVDLIEGPYLETKEDYLKAFRPKHAKKPD